MKIGIFGGSFNPPHNMHQNIALNLIKLALLDRVIFVPTGDRYGKKELVDVRHRFNMLKILCDKYSNLYLSDFEIKQKLVYTYQTLDYFQNLNPDAEIFFIVGADNLAELKQWKRYEYLVQNYKILVVKREGEDIEELLKEHDYNPNIIVTDVDMNSTSSTKIREMIKTNNQQVKKYMDSKVLDYLMQNNLYV